MVDVFVGIDEKHGFDPRFITFVALLAAAFAVALAAREYRRVNPPEPEHCALCGREYVCHAPALLNLATGEIASLEIYAFDPFLPDEIDKTRSGFVQLSRAAGVNPRRIGLSATIGDPAAAGEFLSYGTGRHTVIPQIENKGIKWRLSMEHFYISRQDKSEENAETEKELEIAKIQEKH